MKLKKNTLLILLSVMVALLLTACGDKKKDNNTASGKTTIEYWHHWNSGAPKDYWTNKIKEYEALNPDIKIEQTYLTDAFGPKLSTAFATGEGPDLFTASPGTISVFHESKILYPLNDYFNDDLLDDFGNSLDDCTIDGDILSVPVEKELIALWYNKDVFKEAGLEPPKTWDEFTEFAKKMTTEDRYGILFDITKSAFATFIFEPFVWQQGGEFFVENKSKLNTPEVIKALTLWKKFVEDGSVPVKPARDDFGTLAEGETAMMITGTWSLGELEADYPDANVDVIKLPLPENGEDKTVAGGWRLGVNNQSKVSKEAADFLAWILLEDSDNMLEWTTEAKFAYPPRQSVIAKGSDVYEKEGIRKYYTDVVNGTDRAELTMDSKAADIIGNMIQDALFTMSPQEAAEKADKELQNFFDSK